MGDLFIKNLTSPNFSSVEIPVEFVIIHYTACNIERALSIFNSPESKVCAHFVLDLNGDLYDYGHFFDNGPILKGAHAGDSKFEFDGKVLTGFNNFSVGIEIINLNGNLIEYTDAQYKTLSLLLDRLKERFPILQNPNRILGHEHIAGHRGKVDPGHKFSWERIFKLSYMSENPQTRVQICPLEIVQRFQKILNESSEQDKADPKFWSNLSSNMEKETALWIIQS